jgi:hypothetical protein
MFCVRGKYIKTFSLTNSNSPVKLLEQQPYADADDSFFEEQEYSTVSALLGERAKPFLGIPTGPLQVGHFIGALVIVLMAFVEYPGFPLTNLPSPLRVALQGGECCQWRDFRIGYTIDFLSLTLVPSNVDNI